MPGYIVLVPHKPGNARKVKLVRYPARGHALYTREEALNLLKRFKARQPQRHGTDLEPYAEGVGIQERFVLSWIEEEEKERAAT